MEKKWLEIEVKISGEGVDLVPAALNDLGCTGVIVEEKKLDTFVQPCWELDKSQDYRVKAYFPEPENMRAWLEELKVRLKDIGSFFPGEAPVLVGMRKLEDEAWAEDWKQYFHAFRVGRHLVFKPTWENSQVSDGDIVINIDPGMAFGTGTHPTTRLCLESLSLILEDDSPPAKVLDVGTGSGILAMAAAALGAQKVVACDVDETARKVARSNVVLNAMENKVEISNRLLSGIEEKFDMVVANILAEENVRLASDLIRCLKKGGWLILSGILAEKEPLIEAGFASFALTPPRITRLEDWSCFTYKKGD